jgi:hypothetical protein
MVTRPRAYFDDAGVMGYAAKKAGLDWWKKQEFVLEAEWKDVKYYGSGTVKGVGWFVDLGNYYFKEISVTVNKPRREEFVIVERDSIDV